MIQYGELHVELLNPNRNENNKYQHNNTVLIY